MRAHIFIFICFLSFFGLTSAQTAKTVSINTPGTLANYINQYEQANLISLTISGNIDARDFAFIRDKIKKISILNLSGCTIKAYTGTAGTNSGIQTTYPSNEIPAYAFYNAQLLNYKPTLTSVTLPNSITSIGYLAFYFSWNLSTISIPASVKNIGEYAFYGCYSLGSFSVATTNTRFASESGILFSKSIDTLFLCPNAKMTSSYSIPLTVKHIANSAFENCYGISSISLPSSLNSIGTYAFANCAGITGNLTLPPNLRRLDEGAFYGCYNLSGIVSFPASLIELGYYGFLESNNITTFSVEPSNPTYASSNGMLYSKNLDTLFICPGGKSGTITIPSSVRLIGSYAFYQCNDITGTLSIPQYTDYIGEYAFFGCDLISNYAVHSSNQYFSAENGVLYSKNYDRLLVCPTSKSGTFGMAVGVKTIDPGAFYNCKSLTGPIQIPVTTTQIGAFAFYNCTGISGFEVNLNNNRYSAHEGVLFNKAQDSLLICPLSKFGTYTIPSSVKYIGSSAFDGCLNLSDIIIPSSVQEIGQYAFEYCTGLSKISLPYSIQAIGNGAFYACSNLQELAVALPSPPVVDYYALDLINKSTCLLSVPVGSQNLYQQAPYWGEFSIINEKNLETATQPRLKTKINWHNTSNGIYITGLDQTHVIEIFSLSGMALFKVQNTSTSIHISFPLKGVFILKIDGFTEKLIR